MFGESDYSEPKSSCFKCSSMEETTTNDTGYRCRERLNAKKYMAVPEDIIEDADKIYQLRLLGAWQFELLEVNPDGACHLFTKR